MFFFPQDGSLNCTYEACYLRDLSDVFEEADAILLLGKEVRHQGQFYFDVTTPYHLNGLRIKKYSVILTQIKFKNEKDL